LILKKVLITSLVFDKGIGTNFGMGVGEARPEGPRAGVGFLGRAQRAPPHQLGGFVGAL